MHNTDDQQLQIEQLASRFFRSALELLLGELSLAGRGPQVERLLARLMEDNVLQRGLLGTVREDQLLGVIWAEMHPGRTATLWLPHVIDNDQTLGTRLAISAVDQAFLLGAHVVQALLSPGDVAERRWLETAGLTHAAEMECLVWLPPTVGSNHRSENAAGVLRWEHYHHPDQRSRMEQLLTKTELDSFDCPALAGVRRPADLLDGYLAAGNQSTAHWHFALAGDEGIGCLLLAEHVESDEMELIYMGIAQEHRGRGLGHGLVEMAKQVTQCAGRSRLTTAVDAANLPACAVYAAAGLICYDRREVLMRFRA